LFNGDYTHPLARSDLALEIRGEEGILYVLVEVKGASDKSNRILRRVSYYARKQLRRNYLWAQEGTISFPKPEMMPLGIVVAGYPHYRVSSVVFE